MASIQQAACLCVFVFVRLHVEGYITTSNNSVNFESVDKVAFSSKCIDFGKTVPDLASTILRTPVFVH